MSLHNVAKLEATERQWEQMHVSLKLGMSDFLESMTFVILCAAKNLPQNFGREAADRAIRVVASSTWQLRFFCSSLTWWLSHAIKLWSRHGGAFRCRRSLVGAGSWKKLAFSQLLQGGKGLNVNEAWHCKWRKQGRSQSRDGQSQVTACPTHWSILLGEGTRKHPEIKLLLYFYSGWDFRSRVPVDGSKSWDSNTIVYLFTNEMIGKKGYDTQPPLKVHRPNGALTRVGCCFNWWSRLNPRFHLYISTSGHVDGLEQDSW